MRKLVKSYPSPVGKICSDAGKQGTCQVIAMEYEHQRALNLLTCTASRDTTRSTVVIWVKNKSNVLMVEIYSKSLPRAIGKVLRMKLS